MLCWTARCGSTNVTRPARAILRSRHTSDSRLDPLGRTVDQPLAFCSCHGRSLTPSLRWGRARTSPIAPAVAAGKIINPKTARSQILGGVVMALGSALEEETFTDHALGRFMNHNFAEYHVPVNADIKDIDVIFVDEPDELTNDLGVKASVRLASSAPARRSPTPCSMQRAFASVACRSPSTSSSTRLHSWRRSSAG